MFDTQPIVVLARRRPSRGRAVIAMTVDALLAPLLCHDVRRDGCEAAAPLHAICY